MTAPIAAIRDYVDLSAGLNTDASPYTIEDNQSPDLLNVRVSPLGPISGRYGTSPVTDTAAPTAEVIRSIWRYYKDDGNHLILFTQNNKLKKIATLSDPDTQADIHTFTEATEIDKTWNGVTFMDWFFFTTETGVLYRTNGTYAEEVGVEPATGPHTFGETGTGSPWLPSGATVYYLITYVHRDGLGESPVSPITSHTVPGAGPYNVTMTIDASGKTAGDVVATRLYRELQGGDGTGPFYLVEEIASDGDGGGGYEDTTPDASLTTKADITRGEPMKGKALVVHQGRLWLIGLKERDDSAVYPRRVMLSNAGLPEQWPVEFDLKMENPIGEPLEGGISYNNQLFVYSQNLFGQILGTGIERGAIPTPDYRPLWIATGPGAFSHRCIQEMHGKVYSANKFGIWELATNEIRNLAELRTEIFMAENVDQSDVEQAFAVATRDQYRVSYPKELGGGVPDQTLIYDRKANSILVDEGYALAAAVYMRSSDDEEKLWSTEATAKAIIYDMDTGNTDWDATAGAAVAITRRFRTKDFAHGRGRGDTVRWYLYHLDVAVGNGAFDVVAWINGNQPLSLGNLVFLGSGAKWGEVIWGQFKWGLQSRKRFKNDFPQGAVGERIALEFTQTDTENPFRIDLLSFGLGWESMRSQ